MYLSMWMTNTESRWESCPKYSKFSVFWLQFHLLQHYSVSCIDYWCPWCDMRVVVWRQCTWTINTKIVHSNHHSLFDMPQSSQPYLKPIISDFVPVFWWGPDHQEREASLAIPHLRRRRDLADMVQMTQSQCLQVNRWRSILGNAWQCRTSSYSTQRVGKSCPW